MIIFGTILFAWILLTLVMGPPMTARDNARWNLITGVWFCGLVVFVFLVIYHSL